MAIRGHPYRTGTRGRSITTRPGVGGVTITAHVKCSACAFVGDLNVRAVMPPEQIDRKFIQHGWRLEPHLCPSCAAKPKEKPMASLPSPAAMKAQANMFQLLTQHFDTVDGRYVPEWSDAKIAKETGLHEATVSAFRVAGFGEIREPTDMVLLRQDIASLEKLATDNHNSIMAEVAALRGRLGDMGKTLGLRA